MVAGAAEAAIASVRGNWDVAIDWKSDDTRCGLRTKLEVGGLCLVGLSAHAQLRRCVSSVSSVSGRDHVLWRTRNSVCSDPLRLLRLRARPCA
ncbi:MAG: hypothetical protein BJ554DRAFT_2417 [Olpidium bornovanus]|uniref:Uncharacterized protein n=1 Tax=Olpidium bornovanus TaxID=278681 RepID=A0A8H8DGF5_9FUNG|nr:MAG: hypothetical protein BJ554DRAFT_2417 [Olpidium bornovanus]